MGGGFEVKISFIMKGVLENANVKSEFLRTPSMAQKMKILPTPSDVLGMPSRSNGQRVKKEEGKSSQSSEAAPPIISEVGGKCQFCKASLENVQRKFSED